MTTVVRTFRIFGDAGVVALFDEASGGGEVKDIAAMRNRPAADPQSWLDSIRYHSALQLMEVASDDTVTISHTAIAASTTTIEDAQVASGYDLGDDVTDWELKTHGLGVVPQVLVAIGTGVLSPGYPVQVPGSTNGSARYATVWADDDKVYLREYRARGAAGLAAIDIDYRVLVFLPPRTPTGNKLFNFDAASGIGQMAFETFDITRRYLQVVDGGTPFTLAEGRTMDAANGAPRHILADGSSFDPVPATTKTRVIAAGESTGAYGSAMNYTGAFAGGGTIEVQAP